MFEYVSAAPPRQERALRWKTLPASLLVHGLALAAVPVGASWTVFFPTQPPPLMTLYSLAEPPLPPPPPPPPAAPKRQPDVQLVKKVQLVPTTEIVAPAVIPDEIPVVTKSVVDFVPGAVPDGVEGGVEGGVAGGSLEGVLGGEIGGTVGGVVASVNDGRVHVPRDANLNMFPLSKTFPVYPEKARMQRWEDQLVVRYVIGKNGRVKEVTVIESAGRKIFDEATIEAIRHWRFRPMMKDGEAQEVVHELTVYYRLNG